MQLNPRGLVPTLQYQNKPLYESIVVCEFLEDAFPDHGPRLLPSDPYDRAYMRIWTDFVTSRVIPSFHRFLQYQPRDSISSIEQVRNDFLDKVLQFADAMHKDGPFFIGKEPTLVDFTMAPWAVRLWVFDHFKGGVGAPSEGKGGDKEASWSRWLEWLAAMQDRKSIKETTSEKEYYLPIYER
jgi:glutathione S-transferase